MRLKFARTSWAKALRSAGFADVVVNEVGVSGLTS